ncbi:bssS family protein [Leminorella grimontii]|uniref:bssS family protein n=1 Tax=Leminorella grimontii TaxID=82981 RepID=UPI0021C282FD|nr:bssS family protein [Leminorella grimontii]
MSKENDVPVFPVTRWDMGPLPGYNAVAMRFHFIASPMDEIESAQQTNYMVITPDMARALISDLQRHLETAEGAGFQVQQSDKH